MKKAITLTVATLFFLLAFAQTDTTKLEGLEGRSISLLAGSEGAKVHVDNPYDTLGTGTENDTIRIETKRKNIVVIVKKKPFVKLSESALNDSIADARREQKNKLTNWAGIDLGVNFLVDQNGAYDLSGDAEFMDVKIGRSKFFAINFMEQKIEFGTPYVGLLTGLGLEFTSYKLKNNVQLAFDQDSTYALMSTPDQNGNSSFLEQEGLIKNKLRQIGLRVPLMVEINTSTNRNRSFHLAAGGMATLYFDRMYKRKYSVDGERSKDRAKGDFNMLPYRLAATVRFGYGGLNLFAEASLTELFQQGKGPEVYPFNIGLTLVSF